MKMRHYTICPYEESGLRSYGTNAHFNRDNPISLGEYWDGKKMVERFTTMGEFLDDLDRLEEVGLCGDPQHELGRILDINVHGCVPPAPVWYETAININYDMIPSIHYASFDIALPEVVELPSSGGIVREMKYQPEPEFNPFDPKAEDDSIPF